MLDNQGTRSAVASVVDPIAKGLLALRIKPNQVTVFTSLAFTAVAVTALAHGHWWLSIALSLPLVAGDLLDGTMAKLSDSVSVVGGFLDSVMDRITDAAMVGALVYWLVQQSNDAAVVAGLVAMAASSTIPYIRAKAESLGLKGKSGMMERPERVIVLSIAVLIAALGHSESIGWAMYALAVLNCITVAQRIRAVLKAA